MPSLQRDGPLRPDAGPAGGGRLVRPKSPWLKGSGDAAVAVLELFAGAAGTCFVAAYLAV